ncbi:MAG: hypothetical protein ACLSA2_10170 [Candidatus Gastranaerophilaceae bacterium]
MLGITVSAETLTAGVSKVEMVPNSFYGSWRVIAKIDKQSSNDLFKPQTVDLWNLSREGDVINLNNPFTGASASVTVDYVNGNIIRFTKTGEYDNKKLTDTVDLKLNGDTFTGINSLTLETFSIRDKSLIKKDTATYVLRGEKISGSSITGK